MRSSDLARRRMRSQHLWGVPFETLEGPVRWLGAMQSQEFPVAKWSVAQRAKGVTDAAMDRAFADGAILRTHILRPTWHFVLPADIRWMLDLTAPRVNATNALYYRQFELDEGVFAKANAVLARSLKGGEHLTRRELAAALDRAGVTATRTRLAYVMIRAELDGVVCSGAPRGKQHTYALFDQRVPNTNTLDREESLAELTRRFFTSHGPATLKDYVWWSSLRAADARSGIDSVRSELEHEEIDGRTYWFAASSPGARDVPAAGVPVVDLVQCYDEVIVAHSESKDVLLAPPATRMPPRSVVVPLHAILLDGQLIGHWRLASTRGQVVLETSFYRPLDRIEGQALDAAVERLGRFIGAPVSLVGTAGARPR